jgi:hypothetical protein
MANVNAQAEDNYERVPLAVTDDAALETRELLCDPILDYLEIDLEYSAPSPSTNVTAKEDQNFEYVQLAYDDSNDLEKPLKVDPVTGRLLIDLTII